MARLARLALSEDEEELYGEQLGRILEHAGRVTSIDTEGAAEEAPGEADPADVLRPDEPQLPVPGISRDAALAGAPEVEDGHFKVPRILEDSGE